MGQIGSSLMMSRSTSKELGRGISHRSNTIRPIVMGAVGRCMAHPSSLQRSEAPSRHSETWASCDSLCWTAVDVSIFVTPHDPLLLIVLRDSPNGAQFAETVW